MPLPFGPMSSREPARSYPLMRMRDTHTGLGREWPSITVVTPVYNCAELLEECIVSVLDQDYPRLEYGIIDGGSTDGTLDIIRAYESRLSFWVSEADDGQADALNKGFKRASSELVC